MPARIKSVRPLGHYRLQLSFADGAAGQVDLKDWIVGQGGVFAALEDASFFERVIVNEELGTIVWPNDVDFCPDVLYELATGQSPKLREPAQL